MNSKGRIVADGRNVMILHDECPCGCIEIPSEQIRKNTYQQPHYRVLIAEVKALDFEYDLYANGAADDCLEVTGNGKTLFTDHDPKVNGVVHSYSNRKLCTVPPGNELKIYLWDTAYNDIYWQGTFCYRISGFEDFE